MGDHRPVYRPQRIDEEAARLAEQAGGQDFQPGLGMRHGRVSWRRRAGLTSVSVGGGGLAPDGKVSRWIITKPRWTAIPTLHIRCGSDIRETLRRRDFAGAISWNIRDPICQGPVPDAPDLVEQRARYILAEAWGVFVGFTAAQIAGRGWRMPNARTRRRERYDRVVLWFEHDSYDQLMLARFWPVLPRRRALPPGADLHRSASVGGALHRSGAVGTGGRWPSLWPGADGRDRRRRSTSGGRSGGRCAGPIRPISRRSRQPGRRICRWPRRRLRRHLQELPSAKDGLSLTQRQILAS